MFLIDCEQVVNLTRRHRQGNRTKNAGVGVVIMQRLTLNCSLGTLENQTLPHRRREFVHGNGANLEFGDDVMKVATFPPGPKTIMPWGQLFAFRRGPLSFLNQMAREYGDVVSFKVGPRWMFLLNHPDHIRDVLVTNHSNFTKSRGLKMARSVLGDGLLTSEGDFHLRQRRMAQPAFHRTRIATYAEAMSSYASQTADRWEDGETLDMMEEMKRLTLAIVGKTLFDADVEGEAREIGEALSATMAVFDRVFMPFANLIERLPLPSNRRLREGRARLNSTVYRIIEERRASGEDRGDLLSMLLEARDEEGDGTGMTDQQIRDEAMTLFLAGHETTANALTWTWYLLSQHPEVEAELHHELDAVLGGRTPNVDDFPNLRYTHMVFSESMRLYPPAWVIGRRAVEDYQVGGYTVPAGGTIMMSPAVMQRDPRYYDEPDSFDPTRWSEEAQAERPRYAYFPFGGGTRMCIGEPFAWMEGVLVIATLASRWHMSLVPDHKVEVLPLITLRPRYGMRMVVQQRSPVPSKTATYETTS